MKKKYKTGHLEINKADSANFLLDLLEEQPIYSP